MIADKGGHYDNNADGFCDVCGAKMGEAPEPEVDPHKKEKCKKHNVFRKKVSKKAGLIWKGVTQKKNWKISPKTKKSVSQIRKGTPKRSKVNPKKNIIHIYSKTAKKNKFSKHH